MSLKLSTILSEDNYIVKVYYDSHLAQYEVRVFAYGKELIDARYYTNSHSHALSMARKFLALVKIL